jgi:3-hydroxybutyryl-CoA dehydrogenase
VPPVSRLPDTVGVVGAGTMGAGIAQLAAVAGARTLLHDPVPEALERGVAGIRRRLERSAERGRMDQSEAEAAAERLEPVEDIAELAPSGLVIEAGPERLELKREIFGALAEAVAPDALLATNTSSLSVTAIAASVPHPERVVGMHFFNPPPIMKLVEVVAGESSSPEAVQRARAAGEAMGRHPIEAADVAGFLVNRCNRPFSLEALRLVQERLATPQQVDRVCRLAGGFPMGPFELMDLVGIEVGFEISKSFFQQSYGEPRWRPSPLAERMAASGRHGRKTGRGWYEYPEDGSHRPEDPDPPQPGGGDGAVTIAGSGPLAAELRAAARDGGWEVGEARGDGVTIECEGARLVLCVGALDQEAVGFFALPPLGRLVELARGARASDEAVATAERFFATLGLHTEWVGDAPGLVLGRIVCQLVNEACFSLGEGVGSAEDIDAGMTLGLNHPRGPIEWGDAIGAANVLAVLDGLRGEYREERYRPAPVLTRAARGAHPLSSLGVNP